MTALEWYRYRRKNGLCVQCGKPLEDLTKSRCPDCRAMQAYAQKIRRKARKQLGKCANCSADAIPGQVFCPECAAKNRQRSIDYYYRGGAAKNKEGEHDGRD